MSSSKKTSSVPVHDTQPTNVLINKTLNTWQQRIRLYCPRKWNKEKYYEVSSKIGPLSDGNSQMLLLRHWGAVQQGPVNVLESLTTFQRNEKERMQLNSKFVNNMLPEWSRFITEVKLNRVLDASVQQYPTQSSKSPQPIKEPSPADNFQLDSGTSSKCKEPSYGSKTGNCGSRSPWKNTMRLIKEEPFPDKTIQEECGNRLPTLMDDVERFNENDLALNVDHIFEADECDAFDSDVDEGPTSQTMFMANLISEDPIYDEAGHSYDSNNPFEYDVEKSRCLDLEADMSKVHDESKLISKLEREYLNLQLNYQHLQENVTALIEQNDCDRVELEKVKQHYKEFKEPCFTSDYVKPKVLAPGMYAIDVKPIPHPLKNNRSAHLNYISHLKESVETVREIVEEARVVPNKIGEPKFQPPTRESVFKCSSYRSCLYLDTCKSGLFKTYEGIRIQTYEFCGKFHRVIQIRNDHLGADQGQFLVILSFEWPSKASCFVRDIKGVGNISSKVVPRTPQQNGVVERRNRTLVEAARTMMIFSKAPMFLWAKAVATACYTQNRKSLIHTRHNKTPYELVHDKKPDLTFFRVFGALKVAIEIYNNRTHRLMETIPYNSMRCISQWLLKEPTHKTPVQSRVLHASHNLDTGIQVRTRNIILNVNSAEPIQVNYPPDHLRRWTKDHPLDNIVGNPSRLVFTRKQLAFDALWCCFHTELSKVEPKNFKWPL
ncbi:retrovirus-related pol polyprotein from transposon TNT 1-94 [Tanacetum coccineum]